MAGKIKVPSELVPSQSNQVMLRSKYIYDDVKGHTQEEVNAALEEQIESKVIEAGGVNWDTIPTAGSDNAVKSKDIKAALEKVTGYFVLDSNVTEATVAKTVTVADFPNLALGGSIKIKMLTKNTASNPTLRIGTSNAPAYPLYYDGEIASAENSWEEGEVISVFYDGEKFMASNFQGGGKKIKTLYVLDTAEDYQLMPEGYTRLDYLQDTAEGDYIELPFDSTLVSRIKGSFSREGSPAYYDRILGNYKDETSTCIRIFNNGTILDSFVVNFNFVTRNAFVFSNIDVNLVNFDISDLTCAINGISRTVTPTTINNSNPICIFPTITERTSRYKMYTLYITYRGNVHTLIPCINSDGKYGYYDAYDNNFIGTYNDKIIGG